jgi:C4-dicarboxylate transporter, DctM subunit
VLFLIVMGGIYLGWFSVTEATAVGAFGVLVIGLALRRYTFRNFVGALGETARTSAMVFLIILGAMIFGYFLAITGVSRNIADVMIGMTTSRYAIIAIVIVIYLILGCLMDGIAMILVNVPIFFPLVTDLGFDPIWFGILLVVLIEASLITPLVGMNVFVIRGVAGDLPMYTIFRGIIPFLVADLVLIVILFLWPQVALFLPATMRFW